MPHPHPFDPLSAAEIDAAVTLVKKTHGDALLFHVVTLQEPRKAAMTRWLAAPETAARPARVAEVVVIENPSGTVYDGLVDITAGTFTAWEKLSGVQPIITMEELQHVETVVRRDPAVIEQCVLSGVAREDMHKVYCDPWTIGHDARFGSDVRLQQALMYYRPHVDNTQYQYPLDFCPIYDGNRDAIVAIDIPKVRRPLSTAAPPKPLDYHHLAQAERGGYRTDLKPMTVSQPEGVSFSVDGNEVAWQNWRFHVGFNYREGPVFNNVRYVDNNNNNGQKEEERPIFYRMSLVEMVVPYGNPEHPHQRKHAFDLGEYGAGYMSNSLALGCDCRGSIAYLDAVLPTRAGGVRTIKNAVCIHEEEDGILFKHTDFRDDSTTVTRARKLVVQHIFTAANYEYVVAWVFHQDGTVEPSVRLTGILNTYVMHPGEDTHGWGTQVYPGVNAHNHQHLFCLRINPNIDGGHANSVFVSDACASPQPVGSAENLHGNAFTAKRTRLDTAAQAQTNYDWATMRTWDLVNENKRHPYSGQPVSYKLVSREVPMLLPQAGSLVWKRAAFARHTVHVTRYADDQLYPAGRHVPQTSGEPSLGLPEWIGDGSGSLVNTDVVLWHTFGLTHFPAPEDYPVMPAEPISLLLRPRHFFASNPVMDVPPAYSITPSQVLAATKEGAWDATDKTSTLVVMGGKGVKEANGANGAPSCCKR